MRKIIVPVLGTLSILAVAACSSAPTTLPPGEYEKTHRTTDAAGNEVEQTTRTEVYYDAEGNKRAVQETETTTDPKGLFNKSTTSTTRTYE